MWDDPLQPDTHTGFHYILQLVNQPHIYDLLETMGQRWCGGRFTTLGKESWPPAGEIEAQHPFEVFQSNYASAVQEPRARLPGFESWFCHYLLHDLRRSLNLLEPPFLTGDNVKLMEKVSAYRVVND